MSAAIPTSPLLLDRAEFDCWVDRQPSWRFERIGGEIVAMGEERAVHVRAKAAVWLALRQAIAAAGVPCEAFMDGIKVEIGDDTDYLPDSVVNCGERMPDDQRAAPNPVVVVEVLSPSTQSVDTGVKLLDYFRVPSIRHYLIVHTRRRTVVHHQQRDDGVIETGLVAQGRIRLDPPGIEFAMEELCT